MLQNWPLGAAADAGAVEADLWPSPAAGRRDPVLRYRWALGEGARGGGAGSARCGGEGERTAGMCCRSWPGPPPLTGCSGSALMSVLQHRGLADLCFIANMKWAQYVEAARGAVDSSHHQRGRTCDWGRLLKPPKCASLWPPSLAGDAGGIVVLS